MLSRAGPLTQRFQAAVCDNYIKYCVVLQSGMAHMGATTQIVEVHYGLLLVSKATS